MFGSLFRILKPIRLIKRKGITAGLFGGSKGWLALAGIVWVFGRIKSVLGFGEPERVFVEELKAGQRLVVAHDQRATRRSKRS